MKIFKRGSMMQEYLPHQASQCGSGRTTGQASTNFENTLEVVANINVKI
jgi:hypothetical protein